MDGPKLLKRNMHFRVVVAILASDGLGMRGRSKESESDERP